MQRKKSRKLLKALGIAVVGTTVAVIAAKNDEDIRDWSKDHFKTLDRLVAVVYQEEETYVEFLLRAHKQLSEWLKNALYGVFKGITQTKDDKKEMASISEICEESKKPYSAPESAFMVKEDEEKKEVKDEAKKSVEAVPRNVRELKELEDKMRESVQTAIQAYHAALCAIKEESVLIDNLDQLISRHDCKVWQTLRQKMQDEQSFFNKGEVALKVAQDTAEKLKAQLEKNSSLEEEMIRRGQNNLIIYLGDVKSAKENLEREKEKMTFSKRSWDKVRKARMHFTEELETLFPNVWLNDEKLNLPMDSMDPFIESVLNDILFLEKELAKLQTVQDSEINSAIEKLKSSKDPDAVVAAAVNLEGSKEKRLRQDEMQKAMLTHKARCEKSGRQMMKQQAEVFADLRAEALAVREREVERRTQLTLDERLAALRGQHRLELAKMVGRIQGANEAIAQQGSKNKEQQERQQFWSAAQSLVSAVNPVGRQREPRPLKNEIANVAKVTPEGDELVETVLDSIPAQAVDRGVDSENNLRERFITLEKEARKVAGVPEGEVSLLQLWLARLQSALYVDLPIPQQELQNEPIDVSDLNNYEVLKRARYYVDRGEFEQAVRYLNLLHGPSLKLASDWTRDVLAYLETRQAAEVLLAHASSARLQA